MEFKATKCWLKAFDSNKVIVEVIQKRRLYKLVGVTQSFVVKCNTKIKKNDLWHEKLKHVSIHVLTTMDNNNLVENMDLNGNYDLMSFLQWMCVNKHHRTPFSFSGDFCERKFLGSCT